MCGPTWTVTWSGPTPASWHSALSTARGIPWTVPRQPEWAAATAPGAVRSSVRQSAELTARTMPGTRVTSASASGWSPADATSATRAPGGSAGSTVATVGPLRLDRQALDERAEGALADFQKRLGSDPSAEIKTILRRQALEGLIRAHLLILEAKRLGITVSDAEA